MDKDIKKFLTRGIIFLAPIILLFVLIEGYARSLPNSYSMKKDYLDKYGGETEVLILGSSHSLFGINPAYFSKKGFNLSNLSQTFFYDKELTLRNLSKLSNLRCVLIESSYFSLGYELANSKDNWRDYYYYHFWDVKYPGLKMDSRAFSYAMLYTPGKILEFLYSGRPTLDIQEDGWQPFYDFQQLNEKNGKKRAENHKEMIKLENYPRNTAYLEELLEGLKKQGIKSAIVDLPVHSSYYRFIDSEIEEKNKGVFRDLCWGYSCEIFDFVRDARFGDSDFGDSDHLNPAGAEKFSKVLDKEVLPVVCEQ